MKRTGNLIIQIASFDNLLLAYKKAAKGKRNRNYVKRFYLKLEENILKIQEKLLSGRYNTYILAPEETMSREHMIEEMSYAFNRYYELLNTGEVKQFKHLRKSYITAIYIKKGNETHKYTDHEGMDILHGSYIDTQAVLEAKRKELNKLGSLFKDL